MVMEASPSPQSVGREFVRQYYTLLNKAPTHLHRFYNNQSSFVHGGLDPNRETSPMIGQKQIHQKIQQLNFRDCHAKITQVDSQATLGNGVVVQVTGELSNAGQPMRRFTQTFVLAAQSPKKYYVHNDIFRYQDEIISDEECEPEARSEPEDDINQERQVINDMAPIPQQPMAYYNPSNAPLQTAMPPVPHHHNQPPQHVLNTPAVPSVNGAVHPEDLNVLPSQVPQHVSPPQQVQGLASTMSNIQPGLVAPPPVVSAPTPVEDVQQPLDDSAVEVNVVESSYVEQVPEPEPEYQDPPQEPVLSNEPKTYATLLKSGGSIGYSTNNQVNAFPPQQPPKPLSPPAQNRFDSRDFQTGLPNNQQAPLGQRNNGNKGGIRVNQQRPPRQDSRNSGPGRNSFNDDGNNYEERRRSQGHSFGDSNQLFLGNLPHDATEDKLREIFQTFGSILDLRIHSKPVNKGQGGPRAPPNYGFITYDSQEAVQKCLQALPIYFPRNSPNGVQLNVEEKKPKDRQSYGGGGNRINPDSNRGPRPRDNGPRRDQGGQPPRGNGGGNPGGNRPNNGFNRGPVQNRGGGNAYGARR